MATKRYNWHCPACGDENWIVYPHIGERVESLSCEDGFGIKEIEESMLMIFVD